jgi:protein involved in polysaccharide export with SLBB domain
MKYHRFDRRLAAAMLACVVGAAAAQTVPGAPPGALLLAPAAAGAPAATVPPALPTLSPPPVTGPDRLQNTAATQRGVEDAGALRAGAGAERRAAGPEGAAAAPGAPRAGRSATEYQRFVQEATGRLLPLYGYDLFARDSFPSLQNVPVPADYVVGPGDELDIKLWGAVDGDLRVGVDRNGQISIPRVGTFAVSGTRASQLESVLRARIGRVYNNFQLSVTLAQLRSMQVFVVGQARRPGAYTVSSLSTLVGALFESGGPSPTGSMRNIQLRREGRLVTTLDLYRFINEGDKSADARLQPGDVIVYPPAGPRVALTGAIDHPAIYELAAPEEPLGKLLAYGGGTPVLAAQHKVLLERIDNRAKVPRTVEERALDAAGLQAPVRDGDVVTLFRISPEFANAVTLRGNVASPLRYAWKPGMRVSDLIPERDALIVPDYYLRRNLLVQHEEGRHATAQRVQGEVKNLLDEINWDYAVIERLDRRELRSQLIPFNLARAVLAHDPAADLPLQPGDVVTVFGTKDLPVPLAKRTQYVRIGGEVQVPGVYQVQPGETLDQLLLRAGGFSRDAFPYGIVFTRESTRVQQQHSLDQAIRRMEADISSQAIATLQSTRNDGSESLQANLAAQRLMLTRLKGLRASGRIALELDPAGSSLPPIRLEDGDEIIVPSVPSFVGVFGAVQAETSFIHRRNATVREYLERAGPTRDADTDYVAIIRADGSVETNREDAGPFRTGEDVLDKRLNPGDTVFVPEKFDKRSRYARFIDGAKDWTSIFYQFGLGAAALKILR